MKGGEREREIEFLGCILKPVELSGNCREANSVVQDFPFCVPIFPPSLFLSIHSIYTSGTSGSPFIFPT